MMMMRVDAKSGSSWYASVHQIVQRFRHQDYQILSKMSHMTEYKDEAKFVDYVTSS